MKTPKASTPAVKSKLNTPRSGFITKGSESAKKMKLNALNREVSKSNTLTPTLVKSAISENLVGNFGSGKKGKSPTNQGGDQSGGKKSPQKGKQSAQSDAVKNNTSMKAETPKTGKQNSPTGKLKQNKASPEVRLGLDIEQYLNKNKKPKVKSDPEQSTPTAGKQNSSPKPTPSPKSKKSPNQPVANQGKKRKGSPNQKDNLKKTLKSENTENLVEIVTLKDAVQTLIKYIDDNSKEKNEMLGSETPLFLQIDYIKEPHALRSRMLVPHTLATENSDICLFIADKGKKLDALDDLVDEMKERLKKCGVDCITEILPWRKALHEHTQYEQKKKLMNRFDFFLIENKLARIRAGLTDKFVPKKWPIAVGLAPESKLKENIETALRKIPVSFRGKGLTKSLQFGHYKMTEEQLVENLEAIIKELCDPALFFGGRDNIRSLHIKTVKSIAFPLYISTKSPNLVKNPPKMKKEKDEGVEGELSTFPNKLVKVFKDGTVKVKNEKKKNEKNETSVSPNKKMKKEVSIKKEDSDEDDEELMESDLDEEEDVDDEEISEDEDEEEEEEGDEDEEVTSEEDDDDEDDDEDDDDDDEEDDDESEEETETKKPKFNTHPKKHELLNKSKLKKVTKATDEAEQRFMQELRRQQDEMEARAKKDYKKNPLEKIVARANERKKLDRQEAKQLKSKNKKASNGKEKFSPQKNFQQSNMNAKKNNDANTGFSKNAKKKQNKFNKNKNASNSPNMPRKNQNNTSPRGKKFGTKG